VDERGNVVGVVSAKLSARAALAASGALPENVNYAVRAASAQLPRIAAGSSTKLKDANTKERKLRTR